MTLEMDDRDAARRTLDGDRNAFEAIVRRHERAVYAHLHRVATTAEDAEDLAQETFVLAFRGLSSWRPDCPMRPWLLRIATNAAASRQRLRHVITVPMPDGADEWIADSAPDLRAEALEDDERHVRIEAALRTLPPQSAALFDLRYREELSLQQIGEVLGSPPNTVAVALRRLRIRLREMVVGSEKKSRGGVK